MKLDVEFSGWGGVVAVFPALTISIETSAFDDTVKEAQTSALSHGGLKNNMNATPF